MKPGGKTNLGSGRGRKVDYFSGRSEEVLLACLSRHYWVCVGAGWKNGEVSKRAEEKRQMSEPHAS